jgi:hypothetical protein
MADFARGGEAVGEKLGWKPGEFAALSMDVRAELDDQALGLWPITPALYSLLKKTPVVECTVAQLLVHLSNIRPTKEEMWGQDWPRGAKALATELRRYSPNLRRLGIKVEWLKKRSDGQRVRITNERAVPLVPLPGKAG